jgi:hypothetical protein
VYIKFAFPAAGAVHYLVAIGLTILLATLSYFLIEQPIRKKSFLKSRRSAYIFFIITTLLFIAVAVATILGKGWPQRYTATKNYTSHRDAQLIDWREKSMRTKCWLAHTDKLTLNLDNCIKLSKNRKNILLIGDSHAAHLLPGLKKNFPNQNFSLLAVDSCYLIKRRTNQSPACNELSEWVERTDLSTFDAVLYSGRNLNTEIPAQTMQRLNKIASETKLYFIGPVPYFEPNMPSLFPHLTGKMSDLEINKKFQEALSQEQFNKDKIFRDLFAANDDINYISMTDVICPKGECQFRDPNGWPILIDNSHMSVEASEMFLSRLEINFE